MDMLSEHGIAPHARHNDITLVGEDQGRLVSVVDSSLRVLNESHFFAWVQGEVQYLLPHEILVCCIAAGPDAQMRFYPFSSAPGFQLEVFPELSSPEGLLSRMLLRARESGGVFAMGEDFCVGEGDEDWMPLLQRHGLDNVAAQGLRGSDNRLKSYFCFFRLAGGVGRRTLYLLDILLPILDATLSRVVAQEDVKVKSNHLAGEQLGPREIQVLRLIKVGMTNQTIAEELNLSPLTVKNHVQKILKKLRVKTRGHAVIHAINLGLLNHD
ncbi:MAG: LuxR C-terminal-related transcriptional regulator [Burkholderiales bacterium]|nr:LuxR C-terminal-related transcriptional regulator [Burkholderiales bacterium]